MKNVAKMKIPCYFAFAQVLMFASLLQVFDLSAAELDIYSYTVMDIEENIVSLEQYRGKVSLLVNVASNCGYTETHYTGLVKLQELLKDTGKFNVLAFPCNQFGNQEPGSNAEIYNFARKKYGVNFPMFAKANVKGQDALGPWIYIREHHSGEPEWNFWKYLVNHEGKVVQVWGSWVDPTSLFNTIWQTIEKAKKAETVSAGSDKLRTDGEL